MTPNPATKNPKDAVLEQIRAGTLTMRPKFYFFLKAFLVALVACLILALSIFIASFIVFGMRLSGSDSLLAFGSRGLLTFFQIFPWPLAFLDVGLLILLEWLLRRFKFAYSRSILYFLLVLIIVVGSVSIVFERSTGFHQNVFEHSERDELPSLLQNFYEGAHQPLPEGLGVFRGIVISREETMFVMTHNDFDNDEDDGTWTVLIPEAFDEETIEIGDRFFVAGDEDDKVIRAYGLKELEIREERD